MNRESMSINRCSTDHWREACHAVRGAGIAQATWLTARKRAPKHSESGLDLAPFPSESRKRTRLDANFRPGGNRC